MRPTPMRLLLFFTPFVLWNPIARAATTASCMEENTCFQVTSNDPSELLTAAGVECDGDSLLYDTECTERPGVAACTEANEEFALGDDEFEDTLEVLRCTSPKQEKKKTNVAIVLVAIGVVCALGIVIGALVGIWFCFTKRKPKISGKEAHHQHHDGEEYHTHAYPGHEHEESHVHYGHDHGHVHPEHHLHGEHDHTGHFTHDHHPEYDHNATHPQYHPEHPHEHHPTAHDVHADHHMHHPTAHDVHADHHVHHPTVHDVHVDHHMHHPTAHDVHANHHMHHPMAHDPHADHHMHHQSMAHDPHEGADHNLHVHGHGHDLHGHLHDGHHY